MTLGRVATATLLTVGLVACSSSGGAPKGTAYAPVDGLAFQPDVVIVPEAAVRASADNGLEFDLDPRARHVKDLQVGDVLAATSLVVGRVLALTRSGSSTKVILGPIALTDLIKDGSFSSDEPVPLDGGTTVSAPALPGAVGAVGATYRAPTSGPVVENATYHAGKGDYDLAGSRSRRAAAPTARRSTSGAATTSCTSTAPRA